MESNKQNIENFERFLRDKTDEFRMYPSKRVWYSIYNNMHPGNRLPSVSMSIILVGFLFLVGYLNTNNASRQIVATSKSQQTTNDKVFIVSNVQPTNVDRLNNGNTSSALPTATASFSATTGNAASERRLSGFNKAKVQNVSITAGTASEETTQSTNNYTEGTLTLANSIKANTIPVNNVSLLSDGISIAANSNVVANENVINVEAEDKSEQNTPIHISADNNRTTETPVASLPAIDEKQKGQTVEENNTVTVKSNIKTGLTLADKAWMDDFAMHNKAPKKWRGRLSLQTYVTPSVVYRGLKNNASGKPITGNANADNSDINNAVIHKASFGVETGISLQYSFAKRLKLKAGVQANYTRYNAHAFETNHPIATSITMNNAANDYIYETYKTSIYSNATGLSRAKLHNETYQLSLPIGLDLKLMSLDNISWYAGATIQPTIIVYGKSYIISTDRRSYVQDPTLLNRFNLNAGFETYISYKTASGYTWQLGPQFRTQIFSTNTKVYSIEERLQNFGFKIGVTKQL